MNTDTFANALLIMLTEENNGTFKNFNYNSTEKHILVTCPDSSTFFLQICKSEYHTYIENRDEEREIPTVDTMKDALTILGNENPLFLIIITALAKLLNMEALSLTTFSNILERITPIMQSLEDDYQKFKQENNIF